MPNEKPPRQLSHEMIRTPPLRALWYFVITARLGGLANAAQKLNITQPAVTRQIHLIEDSLGTVLLDRSGRNVRLTHEGEALASKIEDAFFHIFDHWDQRLKPVKKAVDTIEVRALKIFARYHLVPAISRVKASNINERFKIRECSSQNELFENPDALVISCNKVLPNGWLVKPLFREHIGMLSKEAISSDSTVRRNVLDFKNEHFHFDNMRDWIRRSGETSYISANKIECDSYEIALLMAIEGHGEILGCLNLFKFLMCAGTLIQSSDTTYETDLHYSLIYGPLLQQSAVDFYNLIFL